MWPKRLECVLHFFVVFTLPVIEFGHTQISAPKLGIPMSKTACMKPWVEVKPATNCNRIVVRYWNAVRMLAWNNRLKIMKNEMNNLYDICCYSKNNKSSN